MLVFILFITFFFSSGFSFLNPIELSNENKKIIIYITDLNLYPTPLTKPIIKNLSEKKNGLLIYESQTIFQEIIRFINQKYNYNLVIFGGNNIADVSVAEKENLWNLFLDMVSEIKSDYFTAYGKNDLKNKNNKYRWQYLIDDVLLIGLDDSLFFDSNELAISAELNWLKNLLLKNKNKNTIIFSHKFITNSKFLNVIKENPQIKILFSGNELLNKINREEGLLFVSSASPTAFPCNFKVIEISNEKIEIKTINVPLKGIIKKAEESLITSDIAKELFPANLKQIKPYVTGAYEDLNCVIDLKNR